MPEFVFYIKGGKKGINLGYSTFKENMSLY